MERGWWNMKYMYIYIYIYIYIYTHKYIWFYVCAKSYLVWAAYTPYTGRDCIRVGNLQKQSNISNYIMQINNQNINTYMNRECKTRTSQTKISCFVLKSPLEAQKSNFAEFGVVLFPRKRYRVVIRKIRDYDYWIWQCKVRNLKKLL